jgi:hypothetical protein
VYISAPAGNVGLTVAQGTKNAVVATSDGSRLLYAEEATEVWFSDYGFGQLIDGVAVISINPTFAQTVNLSEPYHVFLEEFGDADVYIADRTPEKFVVRVGRGDPDVQFGYRIVAKRLGYEGARLEPAPWADEDPNLYPEKREAWEELQAELDGLAHEELEDEGGIADSPQLPEKPPEPAPDESAQVEAAEPVAEEVPAEPAAATYSYSIHLPLLNTD